jgi:hypothetical protein
MYKDILIDNMIAKNFCNPISEDYKKIIRWLQKDGSLVVCTQLLKEYSRSTAMCESPTNIWVIIEMQKREGRLNKIENSTIKAFVFPKQIIKKLRSHNKDWCIIKTVLLSDRKIALCKEDDVIFDILNFPGYSCCVGKNPSLINYQ